jgi:carbon starvation protein
MLLEGLLAIGVVIAVSIWLVNRKKTAWFTVLPAIFMMMTTLYSLIVLLFEKYLPKKNYMLSAVDILLIIMSISVIYIAFKKWQEIRKNQATGAA